MKTIGLIGGITWYSTLDYYRYINTEVNKLQGGDEAAKLILVSVNYGEIKKLTHEGNWKAIIEIMVGAAQKLENAGSDCILLCANTMHHIADEIAQSVSLPLIHIADVTAADISKKNINQVALLGTKYTMQFDFYKQKLAGYNIEIIIPKDHDIELVNKAIYNELGKGILLNETKNKFISIIEGLVSRGAQGVILGCTEIPLLITQVDCPVPVFDTTLIHARAAVDFALENRK